MKTEQGNSYGMYSKIGWETREKPEYLNDNDAILFSFKKNKIYKTIKGKSKICWINNTYGFCLYDSIGFNNNFLKKKDNNIYTNITSNFENCEIEDFNSGFQNFKFKEIEIFHIQ